MTYAFIDNDELNTKEGMDSTSGNVSAGANVGANVNVAEGMDGVRYTRGPFNDMGERMGGMGGMGDMGRMGGINFETHRRPYEVPQTHLRESHSLHPHLDFYMFLFLAFVLSFVIFPGAALYAGGSPIYYLATALVCTIISYGLYFHYFYM
jgi:hypothetical protein